MMAAHMENFKMKRGTIVCHWWATLPASYVATQYDAKALKESREKLVDGHVGRCSRAQQSIMGYVLSMNQHKLIGGLHGDNGMGQECQVMRGEYRNSSKRQGV